MNKKILILAALLICLSFIFQEVNLTGYSIYYHGDSFESGGKTITIKKISPTNVVIDVDGVKNIISAGDKKIINDVDIEVLEIFYTDEVESRNVDLVLDVMETEEPDEEEEEEEEKEGKGKDECKDHEECDDGDFRTEDLCVDLKPKVCKHYTVDKEVAEIEETSPEPEEEVSETEEEEEIEETLGFFARLSLFFKNLF